MKNILKFSKVFFSIGVLALASCFATVFADKGGQREIVLAVLNIYKDEDSVYTVRYVNKVARENEDEAITAAINKYNEFLRPRLVYDFEAQTDFIKSCKTKEDYDKKLIELISSDNHPIKGACINFSTCLQLIFDEHRVENYLLCAFPKSYKKDDGENCDAHSAVMYKHHDKWFVADPTVNINKDNDSLKKILEKLSLDSFSFELENYKEFAKQLLFDSEPDIDFYIALESKSKDVDYIESISLDAFNYFYDFNCS